MHTSYHDTATHTVTTKRHARITRSMKQLKPALLKVLTELRYMIRDNESLPVSNALLARRTSMSEGYISVLVRQLAGETVRMRSGTKELVYHGCPRPFIRRELREDGRFITTMLPPPEQRGAPVGDHGDDPQVSASFDAPASPKTPQIGDLYTDPPIHIHASMHGEERPASPSSASLPESEPAPDPLVGTVYEVCKISPAMATPKQRGQAQQLAALLASVHATPDAVRRAARWFAKHDWRGKKGETPTPALLREIWGQVPKPEITPLAAPRPAEPAEAFLTPAQIRAKLQQLGVAPKAEAESGWSPWGGQHG